MKKDRIIFAILTSSIISLTGCGGDSNNTTISSGTNDELVDSGNHLNPDGEQNSEVPNENSGGGKDVENTDTQNKTQFHVFDVNNILLKNTTVKILAVDGLKDTNISSTAYFMQTNQYPDVTAFADVATYITDEKGGFTVPSLAVGNYYVLVQQGQNSVISAFSIHSDDDLHTIALRPRLSCSDQTCTETTEISAIIGEFSGRILSHDQPVANAQISLSGGANTNGAYVTSMTDADGYFNLPINVASKFATTIENSTLTILASGYETKYINIAVPSSASYGNIFNIEKSTSNLPTLIWRENFESNSLTRNGWTASSTSVNQVKWNLLENPYSILNNALDLIVNLASNDLSHGVIPMALEGNASYWFGSTISGNYADSANVPIRAELESPVIDLSQVSKPISLTFKSWWEIESLNPNQKGFDLMDVMISKDGGATYFVLARFNPLSDPQTNMSREAIPYSNAGYNLAPLKLQQEPIPLDEYVGNNNIRLKFRFNTIDELHNHFRGWMIDDIAIRQAEGTFPLYEQYLTNTNPLVKSAKIFSAVALAETVLSYTLCDQRWDLTPIR